MTAATHRRIPIEVEPVQWAGSNADEIIALVGGDVFHEIAEEDRPYTDDPEATAELLESKHSTWVTLVNGDWVIKHGTMVSKMTDTEFRADFETIELGGAVYREMLRPIELR